MGKKRKKIESANWAMDYVLYETQEKKTGFWRITFRSQNPGERRKPELSPVWTRAGTAPKCCGRLWVWHIKHLNSVQEGFLPLMKGEK